MDKKEEIKEDIIGMVSSYVVEVQETFRKISEKRGLTNSFGVKKAEIFMGLFISLLDMFEEQCKRSGEQ